MEYELMVPFIDESPSFVHGYECGVIAQNMRTGKAFDDFTMHRINKHQVAMLAKSYHYEVAFKDLDDTWCSLIGVRLSAN